MSDRLIDVGEDLRAQQLRQLGATSPAEQRRAGDLLRRFGEPQRRTRPRVAGADPVAVLRDLLRLGHRAGDLIDETGLAEVLVPNAKPLFDEQASDSTVAFGTSLTTIDSFNLGPFATGILWLRICLVHTRLSIDTTGFARAFARIAASGASVPGERTGTVNGERSCTAAAFDLFWGDGSTVNFASRGQMSTATGFSSSSLIVGLGLPVGRA